MKHTRQRILKSLAVLMFTALFAALGSVVLAADGPDMSKTGSISISFIDSTSNSPVSGGTVTLYHVAELSYSDAEYKFIFTEDFADCGLSLDEINASSLPSSLSAYASENNISGTPTTADSNGVCLFDDLSLGVYLAVQSQAASGYYAVQPFIVTIPITDEEGYVYDVDATPKMQSLTKITESSTTTTTTTVPTVTTTTTTAPTGNSGVYGDNDSKLPQTGQLNWPIPVLAGAGVLLFILGWALTFARKKKNV